MPFEAAARLEWLETNGIGGWASSTVSGANTRRYHGLLVAATQPPVGRVVLLSKLEETVFLGETIVSLGSNQFPGTLHPRGHEHLLAFERDLFPVFRYQVGPAVLEKTVVALQGESTTLVGYRLTGTASSGTLDLRPLIAGRSLHALRRAEATIPAIQFEHGVLATEPLADGARLFLAAPEARFDAAPDWWHDFEYQRERERGFEYREALWTPGVLQLRLTPGEPVIVVASTRDPAGRDWSELFERERRRRTSLVDRVPTRDPEIRSLVLAADQFLVRREGGSRTVIAGYHWFGDWGRDTLIALSGLTLTTGRADVARDLLEAWAGHFDQGMLPNRFPEAGDAPEYNSVDAALWFFVALFDYWHASGDDAFATSMLPVLRAAIWWHRDGTRHGIRVTEDGLLSAGEPGIQLTWMDARVGERVVTPRTGQPVEINALWINALAILGALEAAVGDVQAVVALDREVGRIRRNFSRRFWYAEGGYLYDVVDGSVRDASLRPNQLLALSLPFPLLSATRRRSVLRAVEEHLVTPVGLRSLAPHDPAYRPRYEGTAEQRDSAYHQGTVWCWLLGPYVTALVRERGEAGRRQGRQLLERTLAQLREAGVGTLSEIFDGESPHLPRGAIAQAWSVAEVLRAWALCATAETGRS